LGLLHDVGCSAIFDRASGIQPLGFAEDLNSGQLSGDPHQAEQGRVADAIPGSLAQNWSAQGIVFVAPRRSGSDRPDVCRRTRHNVQTVRR
jgi:hypothetical protein